MVGFTEHKAYLYRLGFSEKDVYALQDEYMKKLEGKDEGYNTLVEELKEKYPKLNILKWERYVEAASELGSMVDFVKPFIPYAVAGKINKETNTRNHGRFVSPEAKIIFSDRANKSITEKEAIGRDSWDSNIRPTPNEADAAFQIIVNFMKKTGLEPLKVEDLPLGEQSIKPLVLTLKRLADRGAEYGKGNVELRVRALVSSDISNITNLAVPEYGETVNIGQAVKLLGNRLKDAEGKSVPTDYLETLKLVFNPNVVRQLPADVRQELETYFSKEVRGKTLGWWLSRVVASNVNVRELTSNISVTDKVDKPIGFGRPTKSPPSEVYEQRRRQSKVEKMDVEDLPPKQRKRVKTYMQDADPTEYFGEEYLKLGKIINILEGIVTPEDEEELAELDEDNLKLVKLAARLRKHYETLYAALGDMVYDREEEE